MDVVHIVVGGPAMGVDPLHSQDFEELHLQGLPGVAVVPGVCVHWGLLKFSVMFVHVSPEFSDEALAVQSTDLTGVLVPLGDVLPDVA